MHTVDGPATVGMLAERTDEAVGNVSHHVRVLAEARLVEDVPELARDRRERWWRQTSAEMRWARADFEGSPADAAVADAAGSLMLDRHVAAARSWPARRAGYPEQWREDCAVSAEAWLRLSPDEAREFGAQLIALFDAWSHRPVPDDGQEREPVLAFGHVVPAAP
ncbi:DNA-binding transcriptional ArsR family regulator [Catenulispora sp. EB89]